MARVKPYRSGDSDCIANPSLLSEYCRYTDLRLHHFQPGIEFMTTGRAVDAV